MHRALKNAVPLGFREARFKLKRLGPVKCARYHRLERIARRKPSPVGGQLFDIGGGAFVLHASTVHSVLSHWVEYGHGIQELHAFTRLASNHRLLLDIGAAEGIYAAAFCSLTGRAAWAFEPSPEMFGRLRDLCAINPGLAIEATNLALGAKVGQRSVRQYTDGQFTGVGVAPGESEVMTVTTLDAFVAEAELKPDFAKIDVEGMEFDVLRGGERTFSDLVRTIVLEVHYGVFAQLGESLADLRSLLEGYGFQLESLDGAPIADLGRYAQAQPEMLPGYTIIVCRKATV
jgi:FkbM family methyltransferase